jgi:hypothetical protein
MRTPAGKECRHYYQDFHRGRSVQECRLVKENLSSLAWRPTDCSRCPVPDILNANASRDLRLQITITAGFLGLRRRLEVKAWCRGEPLTLEKAYTGCVERDLQLDLFRQALEQPDEPDERQDNP